MSNYGLKVITCKCCGRRLPESCFYGSQSLGKNGKIYYKRWKKCKKCISMDNKSPEIITEEQEVQVNLEPMFKEEWSPLDDYSWVIRNLKRYGNCYIKHLSKINLQELKEALGSDIKIRPTEKENKGYILERI